MISQKKVAILFRKDEKPSSVEGYAIHGMMEHWQRYGIKVVAVFGPQRKKIPADLLFIHVNLSVVPQPYLDYARQYSAILNQNIIDIRKTSVCDHLVREGDDYQGPVIVKSDLNAAGIPERKVRYKIARKMEKFLHRVAPPVLTIHKQEDYRIYSSVHDVPTGVFHDKKLVIQKFLPEIENDLYHVRSYSFLGDRYSCMRLSATEPVIRLGNTTRVETVDPHPEIVAIRNKIKMDYGKLDYVIHQEKVILLDVNKTLGAQRNENNSTVLAMRKERAKGIFPYLGLQAPDD